MIVAANFKFLGVGGRNSSLIINIWPVEEIS